MRSTNGAWLKNLDTGSETAIDSTMPPPDWLITHGEIVSRTQTSGSPPAHALNDLGHTAGSAWGTWQYTLRYRPSNEPSYTTNVTLAWYEYYALWEGVSNRVISLEGVPGAPQGAGRELYNDVEIFQLTADRRLSLQGWPWVTGNGDFLLWDMANNTANVRTGGCPFLLNNTGLTVVQDAWPSAIEVLGHGVIGYGSAMDVADWQLAPYNTSDYPMIVGSTGVPWEVTNNSPLIWARVNNEANNKVWRQIDPCDNTRRFSGSLTAVANNGLIGGWLSISNQPPKAYLLVPAALAVDANRDGQIKFAGNLHDTNLAGVPLDRTSEAEPFRFWVNDDDDRDDEDHPGSEYQDRSNNVIDSARDLEDFARLHIHVGALQDLVVNGDIQVGLEWKGVTGTNLPAVKVYKAAENNGCDEYLKNTTTALSQVTGAFATALGTITNGGSFKLPASFWGADALAGRPVLSPQNPNRHLIFEGTSEGKGLLAITLWRGTNKIGEGPGVWLDIADIKKMFQRVKATGIGEDFDEPHGTTSGTPPEPTMGWIEEGQFQDEPASWQKTGHCIVFVHGWNMTESESLNFAETMFKRLWQRGYKGRFAYFRWPTLAGAVGTYNDSEYRAWKCGESLKQYMASLPSSYTNNLAAHSMGNIVAGSALKKGMQVVNYALLNAAVPAMCYDTNTTLYQSGAFWKSPTPDNDSDEGTRALGYSGQLQAVSGNLVNFFLPGDFATTTLWEGNNYTVKPQKLAAIPGPPFTTGYYYDPEDSPGQRIGITYVTVVGRFVTTAHEAMSYAVHSRTRTVGAQGEVNGAIDDAINLDTYDFGTEHSAQFNFDLLHTTAFYNRLLEEFGIPFLP